MYIAIKACVKDLHDEFGACNLQVCTSSVSVSKDGVSWCEEKSIK